MSDFAYGVRRLAIGIGKQLFIAAPCAAAADAILRQPAADLRAASAWAAFACFAVQIYFAFSSVADMAIGLGRLFGLRLEENFRWPYAAESLEQFWQRWHMGLAGWMREHVAAPARRYGAGPAACDALVVLLCAAWYGVTWGCLAWGLYHAALVALERSRVLNISALPRALRHGYVIGAVLIGWVLLRSATAADAALYLKALAGLHTPLHYRPLPISTMGWAALGAGIIGSAPLARQLRRWSVAIDGATTSAVMMLFATFVFVWRLLLLLLPTGTKRLRAAR
jgi:alginate O-acetyltransferase complex protein AlgI